MKTILQRTILAAAILTCSATFAQEVKKQTPAQTPPPSANKDMKQVPATQSKNVKKAPGTTPASAPAPAPAPASGKRMAINEQGVTTKSAAAKPKPAASAIADSTKK